MGSVNNKPVAWMMVNRENTSAYLTFEKPTRDMKISHEPNPLYTHPADLTDEEIDEAWKSVDHTIEYSKYRIEIAKAILRKAQSD